MKVHLDVEVISMPMWIELDEMAYEDMEFDGVDTSDISAIGDWVNKQLRRGNKDAIIDEELIVDDLEFGYELVYIEEVK